MYEYGGSGVVTRILAPSAVISVKLKIEHSTEKDECFLKTITKQIINFQHSKVSLQQTTLCLTILIQM